MQSDTARNIVNPVAHGSLDEGFNFDFKDIFRSPWTYKFLILFFVVLGAVWGMIRTLSEVPSYEATARVMVSNEQKQLLELPGMSPWRDLNTDQQNEIQLITSRSLAEDVVRSIYQEGKANTLELFGNRTSDSKLKRFFSRDIIGASAGNAVPDSAKITSFAMLLQGRITVTPIEDTNFLDITVSSPFSEEAAYLANMVCKIYRQRDIRQSANQAMAARDYIMEQLETQRAGLEKVEEQAIAFARKQGINALDSTASGVLPKLIDAESQYLNTKIEYDILKRRQDYMVEKLTAQDKAMSAKVAGNLNSGSGELPQRIRTEERNLVSLVEQLGSDDPAVVSKKKAIDQMKRQQQESASREIAAGLSLANQTRQYQFALIGEQLKNEAKLADLSFTASQFRKLKERYESQLSTIPEKQLGYARLLRDKEVLSRNYIFLKEKYHEAGMALASQASKVMIVDAALIPGGPVSPSMKKNLLTAVTFAFALGVMLALLIDRLDTAIADASIITDNGFVVLSRIPVVVNQKISAGLTHRILRRFGGFLPGYDQKQRATMNQAREKAGSLWMTDNMTSSYAESFRELRTNITFSQADKTIRSLLITGSEPGDGKTTICSNLAFAYAMTGKRVLIIDCDLRAPAQHKMFGAGKSPGLSDYLAGQKDNILELVNTTDKNPNLFLLTAGSDTPHPNELLESKKMAELVKQLEPSYDLIILDSPPVVLLSDALLLSQSVDGVIMVARVGKTSRTSIKSLMKIEYLKPLLLGFALIEKTSDRSGTYYSSYYIQNN